MLCYILLYNYWDLEELLNSIMSLCKIVKSLVIPRMPIAKLEMRTILKASPWLLTHRHY
jgi:hypothetical protein